MSFIKNLSFAAALGLSASVAGAETVLIHGEAGPNRGARADALQWFADQVADRSAGICGLTSNGAVRCSRRRPPCNPLAMVSPTWGL